MSDQIKDLPLSKQVKLWKSIISDKNNSPDSRQWAQKQLDAIRAKGFLAG